MDNTNKNKKQVARCIICGRKLKDPISKLRGIGKVCYSKRIIKQKGLFEVIKCQDAE